MRFRRNGALQEARATREVIVSCGAANSPKLLELSGIGNPEILRRHGIQVVHELQGRRREPARPLRGDHEVALQPPGHLAGQAGPRLAACCSRCCATCFLRKGFIAQGNGSLRVFARSRPELEGAGHHDGRQPLHHRAEGGRQGRRMSTTEGFFMYTHVQRTESTAASTSARPIRSRRRRSTTASSTRRTTAQTAVAGRAARARDRRRRRRCARSSPKRLQPGPQVQTDEEILEFIRKHRPASRSTWWAPARWAHDEMAVVDERLRVHGIAGLRVADASIMPTIVSGNTSIPCMMIGEKCADMVLADAQSPAKPAHGRQQRKPGQQLTDGPSGRQPRDAKAQTTQQET